MTEEQIKHMAQRFLGWKLPEDFSPDNGINFEGWMANKQTPNEFRRIVTGTNVFNGAQAEAMVRYLVEGLPGSSVAKSQNRTGYEHYESWHVDED